MRRFNIKRVLFSLALLLTFCAVTYAQSSQDIEMAKAYAKSMGYSDEQINQAMSGMQGSTAATSTPTVAKEVVDRNQQAIDSLNLKNGAINRAKVDTLLNRKPAPEEKESAKVVKIYGRDIFNTDNLSFVPNYNIPTPSDYKLAAGDEVVVDVWGDVITNITATISPEGYISIPDMGLMYIAGESVESAEESIRQGLSRIYARLSNSPNNNHVKLSLGKTRSVTVNVVGDVSRPGSYTVPSLSTLAMVMYMSGGPVDIGSVRHINLYRANKLISTFDVYDFLVNGVYGENVRLEDNDLIQVAPYDGIVALEGGVKRPMSYEIVDGEVVSDLIKFAGGFSHSAFGGSIVVERVLSIDGEGATAQSFVVKSDDFDSFKLSGGDRVVVSENLDRFSNRATIAGAVWREGSFAIGEGENQASDLLELIQMAGGMRDDAYLKRGYIERFGENRIREMITFSPMDVVLKSAVVALQPDDVVRIFTIDEVITKPTVEIVGEVNEPQVFDYRRNMTLGDIIIMAGGVTDGATLTNVEIARRKLDVENQVSSSRIATVLNINLLSDANAVETVLQPYDMVFIRKSVNYQPQMAVSISGEVNYPGTYVIESNTVRLSDLIKNAGGLSDDAYSQGASLKRIVSQEEVVSFKIAQNITLNESDLGYEEKMNALIEKIGRIAIDLDKALDNPGSIADLVLKEGDVITIPQFDNTVSITGHVMSPNSVVFDEKMSLKDYISLAGGYQKRAMKRRIYVVQMNGMIAKRGNSRFDITPGSTIVVPEKEAKVGMIQSASLLTSFATIAVAALAIFF